jgi:muconolactone delta-isomerase
VGVPAQATILGNRAAGPRAARGLPAAGEWRTLGLFATDDADQLQQTLASMPLKIWRNDNGHTRTEKP